MALASTTSEQDDPPVDSTPKEIAKWIPWFAILGGTIMFLCGGILPLACFLVFMFGVIIPAGLLITRRLGFAEIGPAGRVAMSIVVGLICMAPLYYLRRAVPFPSPIVDAGIVLALAGAALATGDYKRWLADVGSKDVRATRVILLGALPIVFFATWLGFAERSHDSVLFYGLFPVDFGNLSAIATLIKTSPGLPLSGVDGTGPLSYHWFFFTGPGWLSDFLAGELGNPRALVLCNVVSAFALVLAIFETVKRVLPDRKDLWIVAASTSVVIFAPLTTHIFWAAIRVSHQPWLTMGNRNFLLLSVVNSMTVFGNNTLALSLVLFSILLLQTWNRSLRIAYVATCLVFLTLIFAFSATLMLSLIVAAALWAVAGYVRRPLLVLVVSALVGLAGLVILTKLHVLSGGGHARKLQFEFDLGQYIRNLLFCMAPLWLLSVYAGRPSNRTGAYWLILIGASLPPTFFFVANSLTGTNDLSMKTASMIVVATAPMVGLGMKALVDDWPHKKWPACIAMLLIFAGLVSTVGYVLQFPYYRVRHLQTAASMNLAADYYDALRFVSSHTNVHSIVLDPGSFDQTNVNTTLLFAERRVYLPSPFDLAISVAVQADPAIKKRCEDWRVFAAGRMADTLLSRRFAEGADVAIIKDNPLPSTDWKLMRQIGRYSVYQSLLRPGTGQHAN